MKITVMTIIVGALGTIPYNLKETGGTENPRTDRHHPDLTSFEIS